jgi:hypothetical protein
MCPRAPVAGLRAGVFLIAFMSLGVHPAQATSITTCIPVFGVPATLAAPCTDSFIVGGTVDVAAGPTSASDFGATASAGNNQLMVSATGYVEAVSDFLDTFDITGRSGTGTATFNWSVSGTMEQFAPPPNADPSLDGSSVLFFDPAMQPSAGFAKFFALSTAAPLTTVSASGSIAVNFTYGVPFVEGLRLDGEAYNGLVDFTDPGEFTDIILPDGASLSTGSGTTYPTSPAPVPEPASMMLFGTGAVALVGRRYRQSQAR